jgi:hypothetical protein
MTDVTQRYKSLLQEELTDLEKKRRQEYEGLFDALAMKEMIRADIHIEQALELEKKFMKCFAEYAIAQYKKLKDSPGADMNILEKIYRYEINYFFGRSLQRMLGIINNVRGSVPASYAQEFLEKVTSDALQTFEMTKFVEER